MKDDLHELIDGGLPDEQAAELLHLLSVDPEKRSVFRQQMRLQKDLCRNEIHAAMNAFEESEMLERVSRAVGEPTAGAGRFARRGVLMLAVGFLVGSGAGYVGHSLVASPAHASNESPDTVQVVRYLPSEPQVYNLNRDSVVAAITDSLVKSQKAAASTTSSKRSTSRVTDKTRTSRVDDPTGRDAALKLQQLKKKKRSRR